MVPPAGFVAVVEAVSLLATGAAGGDGDGAATSAFGGVPLLPAVAETWTASPATRIWVGSNSLLAESMASWPACAYGGAAAGAVLPAGDGCGLLPSEAGAVGCAVRAVGVDAAAASCFTGDADAGSGGVAAGAAETVAAAAAG